MHQKDKSHPTAAGSYLYGAMLYGLLFQKSPEGMAYLGECEKPLKPEDAKVPSEIGLGRPYRFLRLEKISKKQNSLPLAAFAN